MAPNVVIHFGMNKTGSRSVQASFDHYDDGHLISAPFRNGNANRPIVSMFRKYDPKLHIWKSTGTTQEEYERLKRKSERQMIDALKTDRQTVFLSAEKVLELKKVELFELQSFLLQHCESVKLFAYIRDPVGLISSAFQQGLKTGRQTSFTLRKLNYRKHFKRIIDVFGREDVDLILFKPNTFPNKSVVQDVAQRIGAQSDLIKEVRGNEGLSMALSGVLFLWNRDGAQKPQSRSAFQARTRLITYLQQNFDEQKFATREQKKFKFCNKLACENLDMKDIAWMEKLLGVKFGIDNSQSEIPDADYGVRSEEDLADLGAKSFEWLGEVCEKKKIVLRSRSTTAAMDVLFEHFLAERMKIGA